MKKHKSQKSIYLLYCFATACLFSLVFTVSQVYYIDLLKLTPFQLVIIGTSLELSCFLFEIPTGIVADMRSRKLSILIGLVLIGTAFIIEGSIPAFTAVISSQILWGLGYTFTSGATEAWIADEVGEDALNHLFIKGAQYGQSGAFLGLISGILIGVFRVNLPIILSGMLFLGLTFYLSRHMQEHNFTPVPSENRTTWTQMWHTFSQGLKMIKGHRLLLIMVGISFLYGLYSEGFDRLWTAHLLMDIGLPGQIDIPSISWIGVISGVAMLINVFVIQYIKKKMTHFADQDIYSTLMLLNLFMVVSLAGFALSNNLTLAIATYFIFYITRHINGPIYRAWMNKHIKSEVRATVLSTYGQIDALGQIISGPVIGIIASRYSLSVGLFASVLILMPIVILLRYGKITSTPS